VPHITGTVSAVWVLKKISRWNSSTLGQMPKYASQRAANADKTIIAFAPM
jgi:hypothetical protein